MEHDRHTPAGIGETGIAVVGDWASDRLDGRADELIACHLEDIVVLQLVAGPGDVEFGGKAELATRTPMVKIEDVESKLETVGSLEIDVVGGETCHAEEETIETDIDGSLPIGMTASSPCSSVRGAVAEAQEIEAPLVVGVTRDDTIVGTGETGRFFVASN